MLSAISAKLSIDNPEVVASDSESSPHPKIHENPEKNESAPCLNTEDMPIQFTILLNRQSFLLSIP